MKRQPAHQPARQPACPPGLASLPHVNHMQDDCRDGLSIRRCMACHDLKSDHSSPVSTMPKVNNNPVDRRELPSITERHLFIRHLIWLERNMNMRPNEERYVSTVTMASSDGRRVSAKGRRHECCSAWNMVPDLGIEFRHSRLSSLKTRTPSPPSATKDPGPGNRVQRETLGVWR
jgi:hypothetical protein